MATNQTHKVYNLNKKERRRRRQFIEITLHCALTSKSHCMSEQTAELRKLKRIRILGIKTTPPESCKYYANIIRKGTNCAH